ncbi:MAG: hypothetical protein CMP76_16830 [Flavobacterium sp.]|nr:hypothetical protein [Flavobacterium sp.]|tara:strand:+ start:6644 stop:6943 length:300 start_codon:yes stop_codon:yes gene_type:complete
MIAFNGFAQEKFEAKATELTKQFSEKLGEQKLSSEQENQIQQLFIEKLKDLKKLKKEEGLSEEAQATKTKEIHKEYSKKIHEILTKEQKKALKEYNANK